MYWPDPGEVRLRQLELVDTGREVFEQVDMSADGAVKDELIVAWASGQGAAACANVDDNVAFADGDFDVIRNGSDGTIRGYDGVVIEGINGEQLFNDGTIIAHFRRYHLGCRVRGRVACQHRTYPWERHGGYRAVPRR